VDRIALRGIRVQARHGADPGERERDQTFEIDIVAEIDLTEAASSDEIEATMHYGRLYRRVVEITKQRSFALLERLASEVLSTIFDDPRVVRAEVTVTKPGRLDGATPAVTLARPNPRYAGHL
jgi:dihydroneopterin aldolase